MIGRLVKGCTCGCVLVVLLVVLAGRMGWQWITAPPPSAPKIGGAVALRPLFIRTRGNPYSAGTAVAVRLKAGSPPIILTALHLFGPAGGLEKDLAPAEIDQQIKEVWLSPVAGGRRVAARARGAIRKTGKRLAGDGADVREDVAAFKLNPKHSVNVLSLATDGPKLGEWVWLVGDVFDHEPQTQRLFAGRTLGAGDPGTTIKFHEQFPLRAFSGAPLINSRKEVVGLLISGSDEVGIGIINPADSIRQKLSAPAR